MTRGPSFGEANFSAAKLGNKARTRRLVQVVDQLVRHPGGTLPQKLNDPAALKATYRLMDCDAVTHDSVLAAHQAETQRRVAAHEGPLLVLCDSTELNFTSITSLKRLGQVGDGSCQQRGYICHNCLIVDPATREVIGLAEQILHTRAQAPEGETPAQCRQRKSRESRLWPEGTRGLPEDSKLIVVCDRGGDTFEELEHELKSKRRFVIRAKHLNRCVLTGHEGRGQKGYLENVIGRQAAVGSFELNVPARPGQAARQAKVCVSWTALRLCSPQQKRGHHGREPLPVWVVRVWEPAPPRGVEPIEWVLLTNEPVASFDDAWRVIEWYECRWIVEEYHKAKKTGCNIENLQFTDESRLEPMIALLSVVALTLLNLRSASRLSNAKQLPATTLIHEEYVEVLSLWRHREARPDWSVHDFFMALARLGGHQNRRRDPRPGWLVLWRGWTKLEMFVTGARAERRRRKVG